MISLSNYICVRTELVNMNSHLNQDCFVTVPTSYTHLLNIILEKLGLIISIQVGNSVVKNSNI